MNDDPILIEAQSVIIVQVPVMPKCTEKKTYQGINTISREIANSIIQAHNAPIRTGFVLSI